MRGSDGSIVRNVRIVGLTRTRLEVMHRELLFKPGDRLSTSVIDETARNLRAVLFLGEIDVRTRQVATDSIDVIVSVRDLYSRALTPLLSGEPGELSYGVVGLDYNLLGSGQVLQVTALHDAVTGNEGEVFYRAPHTGFSYAPEDRRQRSRSSNVPLDSRAADVATTPTER